MESSWSRRLGELEFQYYSLMGAWESDLGSLLVLLLICCVTLSKSLLLSETVFLTLEWVGLGIRIE